MKVPAAAVFVAIALAAIPHAAQPQAPAGDLLVKENITVKLTDHVFVIPSGNDPLVPNIGIIVGTTGTMVVDSGLGLRNGQTVLREVAKVSKNADLYVTSTSFSPEHALGESAFPPTAKIIRARAQQQDIDEFGAMAIATSSEQSVPARALVQGARFRRGDMFFAREYSVDLGGVRVQISWMGPTSTRGDTTVFVNGDRVLFSGDVAMDRTFLPFSSPYSSPATWLSSFDRMDALGPARVVPGHGAMGDPRIIGQGRGYLEMLQARVAALKSQGFSSDEAAGTVTDELKVVYPDWAAPGRIAQAVSAVYAELR
jgi:glyoxylase-like metal-dependent hydrolase (beta-lactamase superfamily II)